MLKNILLHFTWSKDNNEKVGDTGKGDTEKVVSWKSKGLSNETFTTYTTTDNSLSLSIKWCENSNFCLIF